MLFIMRGASCSGKDTFIDKFYHNRNAVLSSDQFRELLFGDIGSQQQNDRVFDMIFNILETRMLNRVNWTVLNSTNLRFKDVHRPIELCKKYHVPFTFISIIPPDLEVMIERNKKRRLQTGLDIPELVLERHHARYENCKEPFLREATYNELCTWVEIDQDYEVVQCIQS